VTKIAVDDVRPDTHGFMLRGQGDDRGEYRIDIQFELPLDARTRVVLGELLTQATVTVSRTEPERAGRPARARRDQAHKP
jgi:hypothetical protein